MPTVFLTAKVDLVAIEAAIDDVARGYLLKPLSGGHLLGKIDEVLFDRQTAPRRRATPQSSSTRS